MDSELVTITDNVVAAVWEREFNQTMLLDPRAGFMLGEGLDGEKPPTEFMVLRNKAIGVPYAGFVSPAASCEDDATDRVMFEGNLAHSVMGDGLVSYRNQRRSSQLRCAVVNEFTAYKTTGGAVNSVIKSKHIQVKNIKAIDTGKGLMANSMGLEGDDLLTEISDSYVLAESELSRDCESENWCDSSAVKRQIWLMHQLEEKEEVDESEIDLEVMNHAKHVCTNKYGTIIPLHTEMKTDPIATADLGIPLEKQMGDSSYAGVSEYHRVTFEGFNKKNPFCGGDDLKAIVLNKSGSDIHPLAYFYDSKFINSNDEGFGYMFTPPNSWTTVRECGSFPCTGPLNTVWNFHRTTF